MLKLADPWIFVSHSNADIQAVRRVRNQLEHRGANLILFYLKQQMDNHLLWQLIDREVHERRFFLLCDSPSARTSIYVQLEIELVRSLASKRFVQIDLNTPHSEQDAGIAKLLRAATIFVSYSRTDRNFVMPVHDHLLNNDFSVWSDTGVMLSENWLAEINRNIAQAADGGAFLYFTSAKAVESQFVQHECAAFLSRAHGTGSHFIVVAIDTLDFTSLPGNLQQYQWRNVSRQTAPANFAARARHHFLDASQLDPLSTARLLADYLMELPTGG